MKGRPTPETDAFFRSFVHGDATPSHAEYYDRLRQLERERDEAIDDGLEQARLLGMSGSREAQLIRERDEAREQRDRLAAECGRSLAEIMDERDEAREQRDKAVNDYESAALLATRMQEQRDRLAEVLRDILADMPAIANSGWACIKRAKAALAAVEGWPNEKSAATGSEKNDHE